MVWGLAFKLTLPSGVAKLVSGDETWRALTALTYYYETQPIPAWTSWFAHHAPRWFHTTSTVGMFGIELIVPFLIMAPVGWLRTRLTGCLLLCALPVAIGATGHYGIFNLLAIVLYLTLLDDGHVRRLIPRRILRTDEKTGAAAPEPPLWQLSLAVLGIGVAVMSGLALWHEATYTRPHPEWSNRALSLVRPTHSINGYGLFRTMTTERPEVVIEGTRDGATWTEYAFRWKAGALDRRPRFVQPHMPRLDWLMWFAALDPYAHQQWLGPLVEHLLRGTPAVLALLDENPFPESPPRSIRIAIYRYRFVTPQEGAETGHWWRRGAAVGPHRADVAPMRRRGR